MCIYSKVTAKGDEIVASHALLQYPSCRRNTAEIIIMLSCRAGHLRYFLRYCGTAVVPHYQVGTAIPQYRRELLKVPEYRYRKEISCGTFCGTGKLKKQHKKNKRHLY